MMLSPEYECIGCTIVLALAEEGALAPPPPALPVIGRITVKHGKVTHELTSLEPSSSIEELKAVLQSMTDVPANMMKLLCKGKTLSDGAVTLAAAKIKDGAKLMLMGNPAAVVEAANTRPEGVEVLDDFDLDYIPCAEEIEHHEDAQRKLAESIAATQVHFIHAPRPGMRLLVLDLDHCLLHFSRTLAAEGREAEMERPFMHDFLRACYAYYDLVIWSQTDWHWVEQKLTALGMLDHPGYRLCFVLDKSAMFRIGVRNPKRNAKHPEEFRKISVKPLEVVWAKLREQYGARDGKAARGAHNTVQVDDLSRNFSMNPQNGLRCTAFSRKSGKQDTELAFMARYLVLIAQREGEDFRALDHNAWLAYLERNEGELSFASAAAADAAAAASADGMDGGAGGAGSGGGSAGGGAGAAT